MRVAWLAPALACTVVGLGCFSACGSYSGAAMRDSGFSRPIPGVRIGLTPILDGGTAGWCIATMSNSRKGNGASCGGVRTSTGPIFGETCYGNVTANVLVLTRGDVAAITVAGGTSISTESNPVLPAGLRAAAIEVLGYRIADRLTPAGDPWSPCPRVTPLDAHGKPLDGQGRSGLPLAFRLPRRHWERPARPPRGVCQLTTTRLPRETVAAEGIVAIRARPFRKLLGHAFISCAETTYIYRNEHHLPAAVLLDAARPGAVPSGLPGMTPLAGHPSVFEAPPDRFARRIRGAWLVVQEEDNIGSSAPVELLEHLHATLHA